jgi:hypothetical protein
MSNSPVYGAGRADFTPGLSTIETNMVQAALEETARDEAANNDPRFAEFCACHRVDMSDVSALVATVLSDTDDSYYAARKIADRIVGDWIAYRVATMKDWERDEIANKTLGVEP